jgi:hypothetical protein
LYLIPKTISLLSAETTISIYSLSSSSISSSSSLLISSNSLLSSSSLSSSIETLKLEFLTKQLRIGFSLIFLKYSSIS